MLRVFPLLILLIISSPALAKVAIKDCKTAHNEMKKLAKQLRTFKNKDTFKYYGFAVAGPHNIWLKSAERLRDSISKKTPMPISSEGDSLLPGNLIIWGLDHMRCATRATCDREYIIYVDKIMKTAKCE